jgi:hypothetical protein
LYQYSNALIPNPAFPRFGFNSGRHEVIKAVLMNSAEKIEGVLGSNKTVFTTAEQQAFGEDFTDTAPLNGTWEPHEPWDDANGNGIWDQYVGEIWWDFGGDKTPNTGDAGEGNGTQDFGEVFSDSNGNGSWDNGAVIYDADGDGAAGAGGTTWLQSDAFAEPGGFVPKDVQMGTGQLNAARAITQFEPGEWHGSNVVAPAVPKIGWDLGGTTGFGDIQKYALDPLLFTDDWISITLAWDRFVSLNDVGADGLPGTGDAGEGNGDFDLGDTFSSAGLTDLDLFLVPVGGTIINAVAASRSLVDSVEHIFYKFKPGEFGNFEIWVRQAGATAGGGGAQPYGLAWWTVPEPSGLAVALVLAAPLTQAARRRRSA